MIGPLLALDSPGAAPIAGSEEMAFTPALKSLNFVGRYTVLR
jgi:hypothetical protein